MSKTMKLLVRDAENTLFDGEVDRITSFNEVGRFDIYPMHSNFISIIQQQITLYKDHQKVKDFKIEQAIMKVKQDVANIFLGIDSLEIDEEKAVADHPSSQSQKPL
jgi:F0F1-type ATP synthase epsilon subunit